MLPFMLISLCVNVEGLVFKDNASQYVNAAFKQVTRRGNKIKDFTRIDVEARLLMMLPDDVDFDKKEVHLEIKEGDKDWKEANEAPSLRRGVYKWKISHMIPCVDHEVRIWFLSKDGEKHIFQFPETIEAPQVDDVVASGFKPDIPKDIKVEEFSFGNIRVSWNEVPCATSYDVAIQRATSGETHFHQLNNSLSSSSSIKKQLESCSEYEVRVTSKIGEEYERENNAAFVTKPQIDDAETK